MYLPSEYGSRCILFVIFEIIYCSVFYKILKMRSVKLHMTFVSKKGIFFMIVEKNN